MKFVLTLATLAGLIVPMTACGGASATPSVSSGPTATPTSGSTSTSATGVVATADTTHLPVGDGYVATTPVTGAVDACSTTFRGGGASATNLPWQNADGTWNLTTKLAVSGSVAWPTHAFSATLSGSNRIITGNGLPSTQTGTFPIALSDPAYAYDRNPNSILAQTIAVTLPADPTAAATPSCTPMGPIGISLNGAMIFNALDAAGRDAGFHEVQDSCHGHPDGSGMYHYHMLPSCMSDSTSGHSVLMGYALDGYGIYGPDGENGQPLTDADLDACHGHTHAITWDGQTVVMYHYHWTNEYPYSIGCFHGTPVALQ